MKPILASILFLFFITTTHAQKPSKLDSLKNVLAHLPAEGRSFAGDTLRVRVLCEMGEWMIKTGNDSALNQLNVTIRLAEKIDFDKGKLQTYLKIGSFYQNKNYALKGIENYSKSLVIAERINDETAKGDVYFHLGFLYSEINDFNTSLNYFLKYSKYCKKYENKEKYILSLNNIGVTYFAKKDYEKALKYFSFCEIESKKINSNKLLNVGLINIGQIYYKQGKYIEAIKRYDEALTIDDGYNDKVSYVSTEKSLALMKLNRYKEALVTANVAYYAANKIKFIRLGQVAKILSEIHEKLGNSQKAFAFYKIYAQNTLKTDSLRNSELLRFINLDYQHEKQTQNIKELNINLDKQQQQKRIALGTLFIVLIILSIIYFFYRSLQHKNKKIEIQTNEILNLNLTLEEKVESRTNELKQANNELINKNNEIIQALFRGQTIERKRVASELHDNLGSTLSAIKWRLEAINGQNFTEKEREIYNSVLEMMKSAYSDVRHISHNFLPAELENNGLMMALKNLCKSISDEGRIHFQTVFINITKDINPTVAIEIYSISLELINNILKHSKATEAILKLNNVGENVFFTVQDNGIGLIESKKGFGLKNIENRLKSITNDYSLDYSLDDGLKIEVVLPAFAFFSNANPIKA